MGLNDYQGYNQLNKGEKLIMKKPVYGFEQNYKIDEHGNLFSNHDNYTKPKVTAAQASARQNRYRLSDGKYYDAKYLVFKTFHPEIEVEINDERIIFIDGNVRNCNIENLKLLNFQNRDEIALLLSEKYQEIIRPISKYKNYYISENGNVYSYYNSTSRILKPYIGTDGYYQVKIPDNYGADTHIKLHKMVAIAFVNNPKPNEYNIIHHKDENKANNNFHNLEWTTYAKNTIYSIGKKCCMLDKDYCILSIHDAISDLARTYRVDSSTASKQCNGFKKQFTNGWKARFFNEEEHNFVPTKFD